ncbi:hypothetical protein L218DRAFT_958611 [Marasmius fiardii PR-910]|nr:hypothetical protein L218DRAFT_958611 [Marasmius fiardii PR-910]
MFLGFQLREIGLVPLWVLPRRRRPVRRSYPSSSSVRLTHRVATSESTPRLRYGSIASHLLAGIAGGGIVIGAGYAYYHFSGIQQAVETAKNVKEYINQTQQSVVKRHPDEAVEYLRRIAKSYAMFVPGFGQVIDRAFDSVEDIVEEHREEASEILSRAQVKIQEIMKHKSEWSNLELASKVIEVIGAHLAEISALGSRAGGKLLDPIWGHLPDMSAPRGKVVESVGAVKEFAGKFWPRSSEDKDSENKE